jgi:glycosyltransferase involved in cell wall biosynthesis
MTSSRKGCKIIHLHQFHFTSLFVFNILIARILYKKVILTIHDIESFGTKRLSSLLENYAYKLISAFIVHNKFSFDLLRKKIKDDKISIIQHGNYVPFVKQVERKEMQHPFRLLFFGQIKKVKGLDILLHALSIVKKHTSDFELQIAGRIWLDDFGYYKNIIDSNKLAENVKMDIRFIPDNEIYELFEKASIVVLPYRKIYQSGVLLKSMSFGRAVLCSNLPPFKEVISDGINGFLFESENPESLAIKIMHIFYNQKDLQRIEKFAFDDVVVSYDWNKIGGLTNELYIKQ